MRQGPEECFHPVRMNLIPASFANDEVDRNGIGGGVIPISVDRKGNMRVLLGRERFVNQWRGSCRWSGFEGSRKEDETLCETAVREFREESMDVVLPCKKLSRCIRARMFYIRIVLNISSERKPDRYHATYVVPIEWNPDIPKNFQACRSHLEYVDRLVQEWKHARPSLLGEHGEEVGPVLAGDDGGVSVWKNVMNSPCILQSPWVYDDANKWYVKAKVMDERCADLTTWSTLRDRLERALQTTHTSIECVRDTTWNLIQDVRISKDFLEKDQIRWWEIEELEQVLHNRGNLGAERFRPYFLPVLQTLLDELRTAPPTFPTVELRGKPETGDHHENPPDEKEKERNADAPVTCFECEPDESNP